MKKVLYLMLLTVIGFYSCKKDDPGVDLHAVTVQLQYPENSSFSAKEGISVKIVSNTLTYDALTDANGQLTFSVPIGIYEISVTDSRSDGTRAYIYNGVKSGVVVTNDWVSTNVVTLELEESQASQVVIKEVFVGGTPKDDASGSFNYDKYIILYNNSTVAANLGNLCFASTAPYNSTGTNSYYGTDGELSYKNEGWIPDVQCVWHFQQNVSIEPGKQLVVALNNAVNNTLTYSKSINFDNPDYYCMYDIEDFSHALTYVTPAASIPSSHYLKAEKYGTATAWSLSANSPGLFIFDPEGMTPAAFAADVSRETGSGAYLSRKVPVEWIVDALEAFVLGGSNKKRFTSAVDAGYVNYSTGLGYSMYRNVDKTATEAIGGNAGKIVYNYQLGTTDIDGGTTDPSGIDAEASIKNGARIVYMDTNNSTNDFHLRKRASLRTN